MLRNILRTSRSLVRRQINSFAPVIINKLTCVEPSYIVLNRRKFATNQGSSFQSSDTVDPLVFEEICNETLESLCDYFEEIVEQSAHFKGADVTFSVSSN